MKPFFGIDITTNKKNDEINGKQFQIAQISDMQANMMREAIDRVSGLEEKAKLPKPLYFAKSLFLFVGICLISGIFRALTDEEGNSITLGQAYENAPALFWIAGACAVLWIALSIWGHKLQKNVTESDEANQALARLDQITKNCYMELGVPTHAVNVDVLMFRYAVKKDQIVPQSLGPATFIACNCKVFKDEECLHIADAEQRHSIPLSAFQKITTVKKSASIPAWNKEIPFDQPPYKQYKITADQYGFVHFKQYHILHFAQDGEQWGMYFPNYELPTMQALTGCTTE